MHQEREKMAFYQHPTLVIRSRNCRINRTKNKKRQRLPKIKGVVLSPPLVLLAWPFSFLSSILLSIQCLCVNTTLPQTHYLIPSFLHVSFSILVSHTWGHFRVHIQTVPSSEWEWVELCFLGIGHNSAHGLVLHGHGVMGVKKLHWIGLDQAYQSEVSVIDKWVGLG